MIDIESLPLTEALRLQSALSESITKKFQRQLALVFSDLVGSTPSFARFGNEAGRRLQKCEVAEVRHGTVVLRAKTLCLRSGSSQKGAADPMGTATVG